MNSLLSRLVALWRRHHAGSDKFNAWYGFTGQDSYFPKGKSGKHLTRIMGEQAAEFISKTIPTQHKAGLRIYNPGLHHKLARFDAICG